MVLAKPSPIQERKYRNWERFSEQTSRYTRSIDVLPEFNRKPSAFRSAPGQAHAEFSCQAANRPARHRTWWHPDKTTPFRRPTQYQSVILTRCSIIAQNLELAIEIYNDCVLKSYHVGADSCVSERKSLNPWAPTDTSWSSQRLNEEGEGWPRFPPRLPPGSPL